MKDETMIKLKRAIGKHPVLAGIATGGIIGGVWAAGYFIGRSDMHKDIAANTNQIIWSAYDAAIDATFETIRHEKPEAFEALKGITVKVPSARLDYCRGIFKLNE